MNLCYSDGHWDAVGHLCSSPRPQPYHNQSIFTIAALITRLPVIWVFPQCSLAIARSVFGGKICFFIFLLNSFSCHRKAPLVTIVWTTFPYQDPFIYQNHLFSPLLSVIPLKLYVPDLILLSHAKHPSLVHLRSLILFLECFIQIAPYRSFSDWSWNIW